MKYSIFVFALLVSSLSIGQTISKKPVYKDMRSLEINENGGRYYFSYQNPDYKHVIDINSFVVASKDEAIGLMNEALKVLDMPKTGKDEHINHVFANIKIKRYGFNQKFIYLNDELILEKARMVKIIRSIEEYNQVK